MLNIKNMRWQEISLVTSNFAPIIVLSEKKTNVNYMESVFTSFGCQCDVASTDTALMDKIV